jgi:hypothetical protein
MDFGKFDLPISPELALVDPELAAYARSLLPPIDLDAATSTAPRVAAEAHREVPAFPAGPRRRVTKRRAGLIVAAALAVGVPVAFAVASAGGDGSSPSQPAHQAAGKPRRASTPHTATRSPHAVTARVDGARKTVVRPATKNAITKKTVTKTTPTTRRTHTTSPHVAKTPLLRWSSSPAAPFFDVVLWRGAQRLLDSWPSTPELRVPASWTYGGRRYRLTPGTYLWFVYPGIGSRLHPRYGPLLKSGQFTIASRP